ncbi:hypothetical protein ACH5RR_040253 [Cinchona calisaya]|uniref:Uncharacterized protein n=1 Tax=Cinchona calisaya TaxID=153742 RepID=A0ABD2XSN0_9GENT
MAEEDSTTTSTFLHSFGRNNFNINVNLISTKFQSFHFPRQPLHHHQISSSRHSVLTFIAAVLVNFLQLKYQNKNETPFETHPKTMYFAVTTLLLYCLAYDAKSRFSCNLFFKCCTGFFGPLTLASLSSVLFPEPLSPALFSLSVLFSVCEFLCYEFVKFWKWMRGVIWVEILAGRQQQQQGRRRLNLGGSVYPYGALENVSMEEEDILLPV